MHLNAGLCNRTCLPGCITGQLRFTGYTSGHPVMQPAGQLHNRRPVTQPDKLRIGAEHIYRIAGFFEGGDFHELT